MARSLRNHPLARPLAIFLGCFVLLVLADRGRGNVLALATGFSMFETFATGALVALGLGLAMMIREFDLSVAGVFSLAGCLMAYMGGSDPSLGFAAALLAGVTVGVIQGLIIVRLGLSSVGVTLGGLLTCVGLAYVLTENRSLPYDNIEATMAVTRRIWGLFSLRSLVCLAVVALVAIVFGATRWGREIIAMGSDRRAAITAGAPVTGLLIAIFAFSGFCAALSGAMLTTALATAAASGLSDVIPPAAAAAILGGVSLAGGTGRPLGVALGVLTLGLLRAGLNALGAPPFINDIALGAILLAVGVLDGPEIARRLNAVKGL